MKKYRYNKKSKEIHRIDRISKQCLAGTRYKKPYGRHWKDCGALKVWFLIKFFGYNGCYHCFRKKDTG